MSSAPSPAPQDPERLIAEAAQLEAEADDSVDLGRPLEWHYEQFEKNELFRVQREANDVHEMRLQYAKRIYILAVGWLACVAVAVLWSGFGAVGTRTFWLSDKVLIAFISSTTVSVLGLFIVVVNWLYPNTGSNGGVLGKTPNHSQANPSMPNTE